MHGTHHPALAALSILVAMLASYAALDLASRVASARASARLAWLFGGSAAMGFGIWSMHFTAMLAFRLPLPITYDVPVVLLSVVAAVAASGVALFVVGHGATKPALIVPAGLAMGLAITGMHYIGMAAMRVAARLSYDRLLVAASGAIAITASFAALWLAFRFRKRESGWREQWRKAGAAAVMGLAIAGMHYTAMAAARFTPVTEAKVARAGYVLTTPVLATSIVGACLVVLVFAMYAAMIHHRLTVRSELARLAAIVESSNDAIDTKALDGTILSWNAGASRLYGYTAEEMKGRSATVLLPPERPAETHELLTRVARGERVENFETVRLRKDGVRIHVSITMSILREADGTTVSVSTIARDITERKRTEEALSRSEAELRALVESLPDVIMVLGRDGKYLKIAPSAVSLLYRPPEELVGKRVHDVLPAEAAAFIMGHIQRALDTRRPVEVEYSLEIDGRTVWFLATVTPMLEDAVVWVARDITSHKTAEEELRASEERHRLLFQRNPLPMWLFDVETMAILAVNDAAVEHYGYSREEFLQMRLADLLPAEDVPQMLASRATPGAGRYQLGPHRHRKKDGTLIVVEVVSDDAHMEGRPARLVLARDVTERDALEAQLRQSQKMEAVGQLAGGIAHDFNNLLTAIRGYADLLLEDLAPEDGWRKDLAEIRAAADRAAGLTRQLLAFSRKQILQPRILDLNAVVVGLEPMLKRLIGEDIELVTRGAPALGRVRADAGQVEQVLVNLVVNARDAMPRGGTLNIETANVELDEQYGLRHGTAVPAGPYVMLAVSDTGVGMDKATQSRAFEPFFTTKEPGKGTGLGLSTVYGIVKQSAGFVWVYSEPGKGTTFKIYLPRTPESVAAEAQAPAPALARAGSETILLVEDEDAVRNLARRILERQGYTVLDAPHGQDAISVASQYAGEIHLVITDVVMPEMGGRDLAGAIGSLRPEARVLYISGYTDDEIIRRGVLDPGMAFLEKPFTANALTQKVREVLDGAAR